MIINLCKIIWVMFLLEIVMRWDTFYKSNEAFENAAKNIIHFLLNVPNSQQFMWQF